MAVGREIAELRSSPVRRIVRTGYLTRAKGAGSYGKSPAEGSESLPESRRLVPYIDSLQQVHQLVHGAMNDKNVLLRYLLLGLPY